MATRRDVFKLAGLPGLAAFAAGTADRIPNTTLGADGAKVTHETFGDLRIYFDAPTGQLKSMTAGSLRLNRDCRRILRTSIRRKSSW
jgi:hypothetical protein